MYSVENGRGSKGKINSRQMCRHVHIIVAVAYGHAHAWRVGLRFVLFRRFSKWVCKKRQPWKTQGVLLVQYIKAVLLSAWRERIFVAPLDTERLLSGGCFLPPRSHTHHVAGDEAYPHDAHDERNNVVLLVLRPGAVGHGKAKPHHEGKSEHEQQTLPPAVRPLEPIVLALRSNQIEGKRVDEYTVLDGFAVVDPILSYCSLHDMPAYTHGSLKRNGRLSRGRIPISTYKFAVPKLLSDQWPTHFCDPKAIGSSFGLAGAPRQAGLANKDVTSKQSAMR